MEWSLGSTAAITQTAGNLLIKNFTIFKPNAPLHSWTTSLNISGSLTCTALTQTSDRAIKSNIAPANLEELQHIFDAVEVQTYTRTDGVAGSRVGMIAQDVQAAIAGGSLLQNLVNPVYSDKAPLLGIDYSRLAATVLWGALKNQQRRIDELIDRVAALEPKRSKKKTIEEKVK